MTRVRIHPRAAAPRPTFYMMLGLPPSSSFAMLHDRYLQMSRALHPDMHPNKDRTEFQLLTQAWSTLKDPARRKQYDTRLKLEGGQCRECSGAGTLKKTASFSRVELRTCPACQGTGQRV